MKGLVDGEGLNGIENKRVLYLQFEGGASEVELADLGALHEFPACPSGNDLSRFLGECVALVRARHGTSSTPSNDPSPEDAAY